MHEQRKRVPRGDAALWLLAWSGNQQHLSRTWRRRRAGWLHVLKFLAAACLHRGCGGQCSGAEIAEQARLTVRPRHTRLAAGRLCPPRQGREGAYAARRQHCLTRCRHILEACIAVSPLKDDKHGPSQYGVLSVLECCGMPLRGIALGVWDCVYKLVPPGIQTRAMSGPREGAAGPRDRGPVLIRGHALHAHLRCSRTHPIRARLPFFIFGTETVIVLGEFALLLWSTVWRTCKPAKSSP